MTRTSPPQVAFSSGEIDPLLHRRFDYQRFQTGLAQCRGFLPLAQGGFTRAPGTWMRGRTRNDAAAVLLPFQFAADDVLVLEFTPLKMRVWRYGALVTVDDAPYELTTPYDATALETLRWVQSADVIYLCDGLRPIQRLARHALDDWTLAPQAFDTGPFRVQNLDKALTVAPSAATGTITLTASGDLFTAAHVGSLMQIRIVSNTEIGNWRPDISSVVVGDRRYYDGNYYELVEGDNTGQSPPIHTEGIAMPWNGVKWLWLAGDTGVVRITAVTSATVATAEVIQPLPPSLVGHETYRWSEGAWSEVYGYPSALEIYDQRLAAAATPSEPRTVWFSTAGDFADFEPSTEADGSFAYAIAGDGSINRIIGLRRGRTGLHIFALGEEYSTRAESRTAVIGPTTAVFGLDGSVGSSPARPVAPAGNPIFISRDKRRILLIGYNLQADGNEVRILSRPAQHLGDERFEQIVWKSSPEPTAWLRRGNGDLVAMIYDEAEEVLGWAVVPVAGGEVEAMAVSPAADGGQDILTLVVKRVINGETCRFVEDQAALWVSRAADVPVYRACHLFCAQRFDLDEPRHSFSVPHLAGQTVQAWTDLGNMADLVVALDGTVSLPDRVSHAVIGLLDSTHVAETLDIQAAAPDGNAMGRRKRLTTATIGLHRSVQGFAQVIERQFARAPRPAGARIRLAPEAILAAPTAELSGVARLNLPSGHCDELSVRIMPDGGAPLTITAIVPRVEEVGG